MRLDHQADINEASYNDMSQLVTPLLCYRQRSSTRPGLAHSTDSRTVLRVGGHARQDDETHAAG
jgi:hypothetical protein